MFSEFFSYISSLSYYNKLNSFLDEEYENHVIYPARKDIFRAFKIVNKEDIKMVIIGQDPYSNKDEANGLAFSVNKGNKLPPSLKNIYKEIENEFNIFMDYSNGDLTYLAKQGVLLINTILTVREHEPLSHDNELYKRLFLDIMKFLDNLDQPIVFCLWGNKAHKYKKLISNKKRLVITTNHPSPLSANRGGWFNTSQFVLANKYLTDNNIKPIDFKNSISIFD